jgi:hypothetical protein
VDPGVPLAFKNHRRTRLPSPLGALRGSGGLLDFFGMQITRRRKRRFDEAVRRVTPYLEKL